MLPTSFLSKREREYLKGDHDEKYYQYKSNLRVRIQRKVDSLAEDLPLLLGNPRIDGAKEKYDWSAIIKAVKDFQDRST